jgi:hypothetical protein
VAYSNKKREEREKELTPPLTVVLFRRGRKSKELKEFL